MLLWVGTQVCLLGFGLYFFFERSILKEVGFCFLLPFLLGHNYVFMLKQGYSNLLCLWQGKRGGYENPYLLEIHTPHSEEKSACFIDENLVILKKYDCGSDSSLSFK